MKNLYSCLILLMSLFIISPVNAEQRKPIVIATNDIALVYDTNSENELAQVYFGKALTHPKEYEFITPNVKKAILTAGTQDKAEPAFGVEHADGNLSLKLEYIDFEQQEEDENIVKTTIQLKDPNYSFFVELHFRAYQNENIIEQWANIYHKEKGSVRLRDFASAFPQIKGKRYFLTHFYGDWANEMRMEEKELMEGKYSIESKIGARATRYKIPSFMVSINDIASEEQGEVLAGSLAWSGNFNLVFENMKESDDRVDLLQIVAGIHNYASHYELNSGQNFETPKFIYTYTDLGKGQASQNIHEWATNYGVYGGKESKRTLLNNWEATYFDFDEQKLITLIGNAKDLGVDVFLLDDGWFGNQYPRNNDDAGLGDWEVNQDKLPNGLSHLVQEADKQKITFGIWVEPEMVNPESELYRKHPDWILKQPDRKEDLQRNQLILDLSNPQVQEHVFKVVDDILENNPDIGYIKWDCNRYMTNVYSTYLKDKQSNLYIDYTEGLYDVLHRLREKYPDVELMWCSGGGGRVEYGGLSYTNEFWPSDNTDPLQRIYMQYGYSYFFPMGIQASHVTSSGNQSMKFKLDVAMSGRLGFDIRVDEMTENELKLAQKTTQNYKRLQDVVNSGKLYRLIAPYQNNQASWMVVSKEGDRAILYAYSLHTLVGDSFEPIKLRGLDPQSQYKLTEINLINEEDTQFLQSGGVFSGDYLMKVGLPWFLQGSLKSAIIEIQKVQ